MFLSELGSGKSGAATFAGGRYRVDSPTKVLINGGNPGAASPTQWASLIGGWRRIATVLASEGRLRPSGPPGRGFSPVRWRRPVLCSTRTGVSVANSALSYDDGVEPLVGVPIRPESRERPGLISERNLALLSERSAAPTKHRRRRWSSPPAMVISLTLVPSTVLFIILGTSKWSRPLGCVLLTFRLWDGLRVVAPARSVRICSP